MGCSGPRRHVLKASCAARTTACFNAVTCTRRLTAGTACGSPAVMVTVARRPGTICPPVQLLRVATSITGVSFQEDQKPNWLLQPAFAAAAAASGLPRLKTVTRDTPLLPHMPPCVTKVLQELQVIGGQLHQLLSLRPGSFPALQTLRVHPPLDGTVSVMTASHAAAIAAAAPGLRVLGLWEVRGQQVQVPPPVMQQLRAALPQLEVSSVCVSWVAM